MTGTDRRILDAFPPPSGETYGLELTRATGLGAGKVTQGLYRLREEWLIADRWEDTEAAARDGRPPRRLYRLTPDGLKRRFEERAGVPVGRPALEGG